MEGVNLLPLQDVGAETNYVTDRPVHQVGLVSTVAFLDSKGCIADDPPNTALAVRSGQGTLESAGIELLDPGFNEASDTLTYNAILLAEYDEAALAGLAKCATGTPLPTTFGGGQLVIDSSKCNPDGWEHCIIF